MLCGIDFAPLLRVVNEMLPSSRLMISALASNLVLPSLVWAGQPPLSSSYSAMRRGWSCVGAERLRGGLRPSAASLPQPRISCLLRQTSSFTMRQRQKVLSQV